MTAAAGKVLVSHPGRQHSHQAAMALECAGMLAGYWAGVPSRQAQQGHLARRMHRYAQVDLPEARARWLPAPVVLRRLGRVAPKAVEQVIDYGACRAFDWQVAWGLGRTGADAVVACEISALSTFRRAKALGMKTVLDAASVHYAVQDRLTPVPEAWWLHERINRVKWAEIELADHVLTVSELAREGYVEAGVPADRVHSVVLGADTKLFSLDESRPADKCTFVFAGATIHRKGVDVLREAFAAVQQRHFGAARLVVVGPRGDSHSLLEGSDLPGIEVRPPVAQAGLAEIYRGADCFVLPSRHDSFGMAALEAMACGLPVIVSEMVGAREVVAEGKSGWVVPVNDAAALAARMQWCVENRAALRAMRGAARAAAEGCSWDRYRGRLVAVMERILGGGP